MARNLMGFRKTNNIPKAVVHAHGRCIYEPLVTEVHENGGVYMLDTKDDRRTKSLVGTLRTTIKRMHIDDVVVVKRETIVYITTKEEVNA